MLGTFLSRLVILVLGYAYPAYSCFKALESAGSDRIEQLRVWCKYWILIALWTAVEAVADIFISWLPMYAEAKVAFVVYLYHLNMSGATYMYSAFFKPYIVRHEREIDRRLLELRTRAIRACVLYLRKVSDVGQARFFEIFTLAPLQFQSMLLRSSNEQSPGNSDRLDDEKTEGVKDDQN